LRWERGCLHKGKLLIAPAVATIGSRQVSTPAVQSLINSLNIRNMDESDNEFLC